MARRSSSFRTLALWGAAGAAAYIYILRPWHLRWGATDEEVERALPGDELVPQPKIKATHAVTIFAPSGKVWPWIAQIGQGRGGFYSYTWIENRLLHLDIQNAERILPEFQNPKVGEQIPLAPNGFGVPIAIVEPGRTLVAHGDTRVSQSPFPNMRPGDFINASWGWYLEPMGERATRLIERERIDYSPSLYNAIYMRAFLEPGAFLMARKMLLGIKQRAEKWTTWSAKGRAALA